MKALTLILKPIARNGHYLAWTFALMSMAGSLYFSEVLGWIPCVLCWYARILMYPIVIIGAVGILRREHTWSLYALPLSLAGMALTAYHSLLQWGIISEAVAPCRNGVSCATKELNLLGFITIPFLAFLGFSAISLCLYLYYKERNHVA